MNGAKCPSHGLDSIADWSPRILRSYCRAPKKKHTENNPPIERWSSSASLPTNEETNSGHWWTFTPPRSAPPPEGPRRRKTGTRGGKKQFPRGGPVGRAVRVLRAAWDAPGRARSGSRETAADLRVWGRKREEWRTRTLPTETREEEEGDRRGSRTHNRDSRQVAGGKWARVLLVLRVVVVLVRARWPQLRYGAPED
jgi:hypothetical protein